MTAARRFCVAPMMESAAFHENIICFRRLEQGRVLIFVLLVVRPIMAAAQRINGRRVERDRASNVRFCLPAQAVDATQALNRSAGVWKPKVLRGRSLSCRAPLLS